MQKMTLPQKGGHLQPQFVNIQGIKPERPPRHLSKPPLINVSTTIVSSHVPPKSSPQISRDKNCNVTSGHPTRGVISNGSQNIQESLTEITLTRGRTASERAQNDYVDQSSQIGSTRTPNNIRTSVISRGQSRERKNLVEISEKDPHQRTLFGGSKSQGAPKNRQQKYDSIICPTCGKCLCNGCQRRRTCFPSILICRDRIEVNEENVVDCCTGMLCVKFAFNCVNGCTGDDGRDDNRTFSDEPCAGFSQPHCLKRWICIVLTSLCLPCLCCYLPAKACLRHCTSRGCQCHRDDRKLKSGQ